MEIHNQILDEDILFIELLQKAIQEKNFKADINTENLTVRVADRLNISTKIMAVKQYDDAILYHILVVVSEKDFIPDGIEDNLAGFGESPELAIQQGVENFASTVFPALISILKDKEYDENINIPINNTDVLVHVNCGPVRIQGHLPEGFEVFTNSMFGLIKDRIVARLQPKKINWLKIYASKYEDDFTGECILNGEYLTDELETLRDYALSWPTGGRFIALKQFVIFRVCDKYNDVLKG